MPSSRKSPSSLTSPTYGSISRTRASDSETEEVDILQRDQEEFTNRLLRLSEENDFYYDAGKRILTGEYPILIDDQRSDEIMNAILSLTPVYFV